MMSPIQLFTKEIFMKIGVETFLEKNKNKKSQGPAVKMVRKRHTNGAFPQLPGEALDNCLNWF